MFCKNLIFTFLLFNFCISCNSIEPKKKPGIRIVVVDKGNLSVNIILYNDFNKVILNEIILDSAGHEILDFELNKPTIAYLQINNQFAAELYLKPDYNLIFTQGIDDTGKFADMLIERYLFFSKKEFNKERIITNTEIFAKDMRLLERFYIDIYKTVAR